MFIQSSAVNAHRMLAWISERTWLVLTTRRRSQRSAAAPAIGPTSITGQKSANAMTPSQRPEWVICQVSQPTEMRCIQVPMREMAFPAV